SSLDGRDVGGDLAAPAEREIEIAGDRGTASRRRGGRRRRDGGQRDEPRSGTEDWNGVRGHAPAGRYPGSGCRAVTRRVTASGLISGPNSARPAPMSARSAVFSPVTRTNTPAAPGWRFACSTALRMNVRLDTALRGSESAGVRAIVLAGRPRSLPSGPARGPQKNRNARRPRRACGAWRTALPSPVASTLLGPRPELLRAYTLVMRVGPLGGAKTVNLYPEAGVDSGTCHDQTGEEEPDESAHGCTRRRSRGLGGRRARERAPARRWRNAPRRRDRRRRRSVRAPEERAARPRPELRRHLGGDAHAVWPAAEPGGMDVASEAGRQVHRQLPHRE